MSPLVALQSVDVEWARVAALQLLGLGLAGGVAATVLAVLYRRTTARAVPAGVAPFIGFATVGCWLLGDALIRGSLVGATGLTDEATATYVLAAAAVGAVAGTGGGRLGDRVAADVYGIDRIVATGVHADRLRDARLVVAVDLPGTVEQADGYGPVSPAVERSLTDATFRVPSSLSGDALAARLEERISADYDVDHVQVILDESDGVDAIAVGRNRRGLGLEIPPEKVAIAVRSDSAAEASTGDPVALWSDGAEGPVLVARGRLHSCSSDVATVVVPKEALEDVSPRERYRLVTPADVPTDRGRMLALVRSAPETTVALEITSGGPLVGEFAGWLPGIVLAVRRGDSVLAYPADNVTLEPGDVAFCLGHPDEFAAHDGVRDVDAPADLDRTDDAEVDDATVPVEATD